MKENIVIKNFLDRHLITVQKPGRYMGGEFNQILKNPALVDVHVALAFPDIYDIGCSNLGISILYDILNQRDNIFAERVFAPWVDMENLLREHSIPLYSLESKTPLSDFDLIGFSIPYETLYTNVLNMLDLSNIALKSAQRLESDPIIIAGGHSAFNPEPMHAFIDAFVIGEGEEVIIEIVNKIKELKAVEVMRSEIIDSLGSIDGIYIPGHFNIETSKNGSIKAITKKDDSSKSTVTKRIVKKLPPVPENPIVPNIQIFQDRSAVEIMRGCPRGCRFCQAGMVMRPVRERSPDEILNSIRTISKKTGISEFSLLSLSSSDHSGIVDILRKVNSLIIDENINFSLPSLRIETFGQEVIDAFPNKRKGNFTIAPEAGTDALRSKINKPIPHESILATVNEICQKGWNNIKLYFMVGFPGETLDDIEGIIDLCREIRKIGKKNNPSRFKLHVNVNVLIPKPHTAFQWSNFASESDISKKFDLLIPKLKQARIRIDYPDYDAAMLEAVLSRGDRRLSEVIYHAWKNGAKFDAWQEGFKVQFWSEAFQQSKVDPTFYFSRQRDAEEVFPWDHINIGVKKGYLRNEFEKSINGDKTPACHEKCMACGIQSNYQIICSKLLAGESTIQ